MLTALEIKTKILEDDRWLYRAIYVIYERQTVAEQAHKETNEDNGVGFSGTDGKTMSHIAERLIRNRQLSAKDKAIARDRMTKYANQLLAIANSRT